MRRILVIRYGGFGDLVLSMAAFRAIRRHHSGDHLTVLTTGPFRDLLDRSGCFDAVLVDARLKAWQVPSWYRFARMLRRRRFDRVYDLQRNQRSSLLYRAVGWGRAVEWSGVIRGCSHYIPDDPNDRRHIVERQRDQLAVAEVAPVGADDFGWLRSDIGHFELPRPYALIAPGGAPHRPEKRAPARCFAALGRHWLGQGITPVLLGTTSERDQIDRILADCPGAVSLCDHTGFADIAELARHARIAVGNDTGAMHLAAAVGCASLVLFSAASDPVRIRPLGRFVRTLEEPKLNDLAPERVIAVADQMLADDRATAAAPVAPAGGGR